MPVVTREQAAHFDLGDTKVVGLAAPSRGAVNTSAWRLRLEPGAASPLHSIDTEEVFVVLSGTITATIGDEIEEVGEGGALIVPSGVQFWIENRGSEPMDAVACMPVGGLATAAGQTAVPPWAA